MIRKLILAISFIPALLSLNACQTTQSNGQPLTTKQVVEKREAIMKMASSGLDDLLRQNPKVRADINSAAGYAVFDATNVNIVLVVLSHGDGVLFEKGKRPSFMTVQKAGEGAGAGYQKQYQIIIFKNQLAIEQFTKANGGGGDINANISAGSGGVQKSANPNIVTYLVGQSGYDLQANWGGSLYTPNQTLNNPDIQGGY